MEAALEKGAIRGPGTNAIHVVDAPDRPRVNWRIQVRELPLVSGNLPIRMLELFKQHQPKLLFGEVRVDDFADRLAVEELSFTECTVVDS